MLASVLLQALGLFVQAMYWLIILRVITSWIRPSGYNRTYFEFVRFLHRTTEWLLGPIRNAIPAMAIDFSPLIALFLLQIAHRLAVQIILTLLRPFS